ncbi:MAG: STAS domain-containing protein, partial [Frankiaceae bacterium]
MDLSLSTRDEGDCTVVVVGGEIDVYTAPKLREQLIDLVSNGHYHLVVD